MKITRRIEITRYRRKVTVIQGDEVPTDPAIDLSAVEVLGNERPSENNPISLSHSLSRMVLTRVPHEASWATTKKRRQATLANRPPCLYLSRFMRKGASEAGEYMMRYQLLQAFLQQAAI